MRKEDKFKHSFGKLFEEAYNPEASPLEDALKRRGDRYTDFVLYREGGIKQVSTCLDKRTGRRVAIATIKNSKKNNRKETFIREARINAALQHPNIVPVYDVGLKNDMPWFTMKFIEGKSLKEIIAELEKGSDSRFNNLADRLDVFLKVCDAVAYAHSKGVLHLDLKPDNIRVSEYGDVVLCDWGLADIIPSECEEPLLEVCAPSQSDFDEMTLDGTVKGTPGYMAPEQTGLVKKRKGKHTDIFSLGAVLYNLLTFKKAFIGENLEEVLNKTANADFLMPSKVTQLNVPYSLEAVCAKALSKEINGRYSSVKGLQNEVRDFINGFTTEAENASLIKSLQFWFRRNKTLSIISLLAFVLVLFLAIAFVINSKLAETNAKEVAEKLKIEKEYHMRINKGAAPKFLERAEVAYDSFQFDDALNFVSSAVELDNSLVDAWKLKGKLHFVRQEFNLAKKSFLIAKEDGVLMELSNEYSDTKSNDQKKLKVSDYLELLIKLRDSFNHRDFANLIHYKIYSNLSLEERLEFCKGAILIHNHPMEEVSFKYNRENKHLDLSGNKGLKVTLCLQNFPAVSADLSNTNINGFIGFRGQKLISLNVSNTSIYELHSLENMELQNLDISHTGISNLSRLVNKAIKKLNISHSPVNSIGHLARMSHLETLIVHKGQLQADDLKFLSNKIEIIEVD